jgi:hypothetical protein
MSFRTFSTLDGPNDHSPITPNKPFPFTSLDDEVSNHNSFALNQSRAVALEKVDRAPFSYVFLKRFGCREISQLGSQTLPCQGVDGGRSRILHRRVSINRSEDDDVNDEFSLAMTSSPSASLLS